MLSALQGKTIKDYVLDKTLPSSDEQSALKELELFLKLRLESADKGELSGQSVDDIFNEIERQETGA